MAIERIPSKMRTFRFNDAMEGDLAFLMEMWGCTATDALTRALCSSAALERAYAIYRPASGIPAAPAVPEDTSAPDELPTSAPVEPVAPIQTQTAAEIEPTPTPIIKDVHKTDTLSPAKDTAGSAASDDEGGTRYQVKILVHDDPKYSKRPKATSGQTAESAEEKAVAWLRGRGYYDINPKIPAGQHCTTIKI